jgi:hypothetical protein
MSLAEPIDREDDVDVAVGRGVVVIVVGDRHIAAGCLDRYDTERGVAVAVTHVEWRVADTMHARCRHQGDPAPGERAAERGPRDCAAFDE